MIGTIESGEVVRQIGSRGGFAVQETINLPDGRSFPKTYTVWHEGDPIATGSIVSVTGEVTVKLREYAAPSGMKTAADINFNNPVVKVLGHVPQVEAEAAPVATAAPSVELPF